MPANTNPKDEAKRDKVARQYSEELSLPMLEHLIIVGIARYNGFFRMMEAGDVCPLRPTGLPGLRREDFAEPDYNRLYAVIARWRSSSWPSGTELASVPTRALSVCFQ